MMGGCTDVLMMVAGNSMRAAIITTTPLPPIANRVATNVTNVTNVTTTPLPPIANHCSPLQTNTPLPPIANRVATKNKMNINVLITQIANPTSDPKNMYDCHVSTMVATQV